MRIVLVRLRLIGDVVFTTPLLGALRSRFPDAQLTYVVEPLAAPIVNGNPHLDDVVVIPHARGLARIRTDLAIARRLRRRRFDVAIDLHGGPRSAWLTWATGAPMRIGYRITGRSWMYSHVIPRPADLRPRHSVRNQFDVLAPLGLVECDPAREPVEMAADPAAAARVDDRLAALGLSGHRLIVMHVSAGNPFRRWPEASFAELGRTLLDGRPDRRLLLFAGPSDAPAAQRIADRIAGAQPAGAPRPAVVDWPLPELRALFARAAVYIGGDSGPAHMAATTSTPIVELLGPTLPERSRPWRDPRLFSETIDAGPLPCRPCAQRTCAPGDFRCLSGILPSQVAAAAERALAREQTPL